jgi:hypothetical protein
MRKREVVDQSGDTDANRNNLQSGGASEQTDDPEADLHTLFGGGEKSDNDEGSNNDNTGSGGTTGNGGGNGSSKKDQKGTGGGKEPEKKKKTWVPWGKMEKKTYTVKVFKLPYRDDPEHTGEKGSKHEHQP